MEKEITNEATPEMTGNSFDAETTKKKHPENTQ